MHDGLGGLDADAAALELEVVLRTRCVKPFGARLAWCSGTVAESSGPSALPRGEKADILLEASMLDISLAEVASALARDLGDGRGGQLLLRFACRRGEASRNRRGALVLHAARYLGGARAGSSSDDDEASQADDDSVHEVGEKSRRHEVFAQFLLDTFGGALCAGSGVLDIAGGAGRLSAALLARAPREPDALRCTLVEPSLRKEHVAAAGCSHLAEPFDAGFQTRHAELMRSCSVLVGLHPDQATEAIVDAALALGKPFAVVPCCVFPTLFPGRRLRTGQAVRTHRGFVKYLSAKHPALCTARLPFEGRSRVVYWRGHAEAVEPPCVPCAPPSIGALHMAALDAPDSPDAPDVPDAPDAAALAVAARVAVAARTEPAWIALCGAIEKKCFAKHEAMDIGGELRSRGTSLLCAAPLDSPAECAGYLVLQRSSLAANITKVVVAPRLRRTGVGRALLAAAVAAARKARAQVCTLHVDEANEAARRLYAAQGFRQTGRREDYYRLGRHAIAMELELGQT